MNATVIFSAILLCVLLLLIIVPFTLMKSKRDRGSINWTNAVDKYVSDRIKTASGVSLEMSVVTSALRQDPEYAWSWYCNLKMTFIDNGCPALAAAKGASSFLRIWADVKMENNPLYVEDIRMTEESAFAKL